MMHGQQIIKFFCCVEVFSWKVTHLSPERYYMTVVEECGSIYREF